MATAEPGKKNKGNFGYSGIKTKMAAVRYLSKEAKNLAIGLSGGCIGFDYPKNDIP